MSQEGYMVISDITGYTAYLSQSELEHAQDSLSSLLNLLIDHTEEPLVVSRLEGDAVISYSLKGSFIQGQTLVEIIERTYVDFGRALERMVLNTTCNCNACRNIWSLDLKFFVHYGEFMLQQFGGHVEMVGTDVNLVHRLAKNGITEQTGITAYVAYTRAAVDALGIEEICVAMTPHTETYEHISEVEVLVQDMHPVWRQERSRNPITVDPEDTLFVVSRDFPVGPALMWDYLTELRYRAIFMGSHDASVDGRNDGRLGAGSTYYCAHGKFVFPQMIVDWQPFEQCTLESSSNFPRASSLATHTLTPTDGGARLTVACSRSRGRLFSRLVDEVFNRLFGPRGVRKSCDIIEGIIRKELASGKVAETGSPQAALTGGVG